MPSDPPNSLICSVFWRSLPLAPSNVNIWTLELPVARDIIKKICTWYSTLTS